MTFCCRVWQIPDVWGLLPCPEGSLAWFFCMFSGTRNGSGLSFRRIPFQHQTGVCQDPSASRLERIIWALKNSMFLLEIQTPKVGISWKIFRMASWCRYLHKIFTKNIVTVLWISKKKSEGELFPPKKHRTWLLSKRFGVDVQMYNFH